MKWVIKEVLVICKREILGILFFDYNVIKLESIIKLKNMKVLGFRIFKIC